MDRARAIFLGSGVQIETEGSKDAQKVDKNLEINSQGARHLGAAGDSRIQTFVCAEESECLGSCY